MKLLDFISRFPDEEACRVDFRKRRQSVGVICKKCGCLDHYWLESKQMFHCKLCDFRTTLRSGTVMQASNLPFRYWYIAFHLMSSVKKSFSALELQRQLGHSRYQPIWEMMHKIRLVMGFREDEYKISGTFELDEGFFKARSDIKEKKPKGVEDRGRGSTGQGKVLVAVESTPVSESKIKKGRPTKKVGRLKMRVMDYLDSVSINYEVKKVAEKDSEAWTDGYRGYNELKEVIHRHRAFPGLSERLLDKILPWVHTSIGNAKNALVGVHHSLKEKYLQNYLDEYCYKFNRRYFQTNLFDNLLVAATVRTWYGSHV